MGLEVGGEAAGVDEGELARGGFPVVDGGSFDEAAAGFALVAGFAGFLCAFSGSAVLDVADGQLQQLDDGRVGGEVAAGLDDLAQLVVQRLDRVRRVDHLADRRPERHDRGNA